MLNYCKFCKEYMFLVFEKSVLNEERIARFLYFRITFCYILTIGEIIIALYK